MVKATQPKSDKKPVVKPRAATKRGTPAPRKTRKRSKSKKKSMGRPPRINAETYNAMYQAYRDQQNVSHVSRTAKVNYETAEFYVSGPGKPSYAMEPIGERYLKAERAKHDEQDLTTAKAAAMRLSLVDAILNLAQGEGVLHQSDIKTRLEDYEAKVAAWNQEDPKTRGDPPRPEVHISLGVLSKVVDRMTRTEQFLRGGHDSMMGITGDASHRFGRYTDEELMEHAFSGRVPDHDRSANNNGV